MNPWNRLTCGSSRDYLLARNVEAAAALGVVLSYGGFDLVVVAWQLCQNRDTSQMLEVVHSVFANASPIHALKWVEWQGRGVVVCRANSQAMNDIIPPWVRTRCPNWILRLWL